MSLSNPNITAEALWIAAAKRVEIRDVNLSSPGADEVCVRTIYSAISRGTESLVFTGSVPHSEHTRMRAPFQEGEFSFPVKYGYINVGVVEQGPTELIGERVFCLFPHQTRYVVPVDAVTVLPGNVSTELAVLCANMETAINALWDARPSLGDRISVVGGGVVGCLVAWLASGIPGCDVELIDINRERQSVATKLGFGFNEPGEASQERDLVIHTSASEAGLQTAMSLAGFEATVLELSWYGDRYVSVPLGGAYHSQRLTLKCSQVGRLPANQLARWSYKRRLTLAMSLLHDVRLCALISGESRFNQLPDVYATLISDSHKALCHRIRYDT